jgi:hypothetical protein
MTTPRVDPKRSNYFFDAKQTAPIIKRLDTAFYLSHLKNAMWSTTYIGSNRYNHYGYIQYQEGRDHIYLDRLESHDIGGGFGRAAMLYLLEIAFKKFKDTLDSESPFAGLRLSASYSSHIFYLYMGLIPENGVNLDLKPIIKSNYAYVRNNYGIVGEIAIKEITVDDIFKNRNDLINLSKKEFSYLKNKFISQLLECLESQVSAKYPNTSEFDSVTMILSNEGKKRWLETIELYATKGIFKFEPFRKFEQLRPFMTDAQIACLDTILIERANIEAMKEWSAGIKPEIYTGVVETRPVILRK